MSGKRARMIRALQAAGGVKIGRVSAPELFPHVVASTSAAKRIEEHHNDATQDVPFELLGTGHAWIAFRLSDGTCGKAVYDSLSSAIDYQRLGDPKQVGYMQCTPQPITTADALEWLQLLRARATEGLEIAETDGRMVFRK